MTSYPPPLALSLASCFLKFSSGSPNGRNPATSGKCSSMTSVHIVSSSLAEPESRASPRPKSYADRASSSASVSYDAATRANASEDPPTLSGCALRLALRYPALSSASVKSAGMPSDA